MKKIIAFILACSLFYSFVNGQSATSHQVLLLGNLVDVSNPSTFLSDFKIRLQEQEVPFTVVLNGDLAGPNISENTSKKPLSLIYQLMDLVSQYPEGSLVIMPGDRDWNDSGKGGQKNANKLEDLIKDYYKMNAYSNIKWLVKNQCPGPKTIPLNDHLILVAINTQWWNHPFDKPLPTDGKCIGITPYDFKEELEDVVQENQDKNILIIGHHPFYSIGNYGGQFSFVDHLKPFPIIGSFRTAFHQNVGNRLDIQNKNLEGFREELLNLFFFNENIIFATAHEQSNYILEGRNNYLINSGTLGKGKYVGDDKYAIFTNKKKGWMELTYKNNGAVKAQFVPFKINNVNTTTIDLFQSACVERNDKLDTPVNSAFVPCHHPEIAAGKMQSDDKGMTSTQGGLEYKKSKWFTLWFGKHYRSSWITPIRVPYLHLDSTFNGLQVIKKGGGRQTTSLRYSAEDGTQYTFRSVNKDPSKAFNYKLRPTIASAVIRDQTSTQHPYGALAVAPLLDKIDILHVSPTLYVLPDDQKLGAFQKKYGHLFGMLEEFPGKRNHAGIRFANADKIHKSNQLFSALYKNSANRIDKNNYIRARIFDMLVGDWSKHEDQWKWAGFEKEKGMTYRPIPRDRDAVFSTQDGILPWLADREWGLKNVEHFGYKIDGLKSLMNQARTLDRPLASEATREDWIREARYIRDAISNEDIDAAVQNMPAEVYEIAGKKIASKLKKRIATLPKAAESYYEILAKEVDIIGSNKAEYILINRLSNGNVKVEIYNAKDSVKGDELRYTREFLANETKEIRIYALDGDDIFDIQGLVSSKIKIRLLGGPGTDIFVENGKGKFGNTLLYDKGTSTKYDISKGAKIVKHWNKNVYEYDRQAFIYNSYMPLIDLGYNHYNGFSFGTGAAFTRHAFGKEEYSSKHRFLGGGSTEGNLMFNYNSRFHQVFRKWDLLINMDIENPSFHNNFYGLGNETELVEDLEDNDFYEAETNTYHLDVGVGKIFWEKSKLDFRVGIEQVKSMGIEDALLIKGPEVVGANTTLTILPIETNLDIDFLDKNGLPYFGTRFQLQYTNGSILDGTDDLSNFGVLKSSLEYFASNHHRNPFTFGLRIGGATGHGDRPFYYLPWLGNNWGLRGYPSNRYRGESSLFINTELRKQLLHRYTEIVPVKLGVKVFFDTGRVFYTDEESKTWHYAYGAGIYLVPLDEMVTVSLSMAFSEENSFYPVFGVATPLK